MSLALPEPQIGGCYYESIMEPAVPVMRLSWGGAVAAVQRTWNLPDGLTINGPLPVRFSVYLQSHEPERYSVRLVWNDIHLAWAALTRQQVLDSCLGTLLAAMGTDLHYLLDQPVQD